MEIILVAILINFISINTKIKMNCFYKIQLIMKVQNNNNQFAIMIVKLISKSNSIVKLIIILI